MVFKLHLSTLKLSLCTVAAYLHCNRAQNIPVFLLMVEASEFSTRKCPWAVQSTAGEWVIKIKQLIAHKKWKHYLSGLVRNASNNTVMWFFFKKTSHFVVIWFGAALKTASNLFSSCFHQIISEELLSLCFHNISEEPQSAAWALFTETALFLAFVLFVRFWTL